MYATWERVCTCAHYDKRRLISQPCIMRPLKQLSKWDMLHLNEKFMENSAAIHQTPSMRITYKLCSVNAMFEFHHGNGKFIWTFCTEHWTGEWQRTFRHWDSRWAEQESEKERMRHRDRDQALNDRINLSFKIFAAQHSWHPNYVQNGNVRHISLQSIASHKSYCLNIQTSRSHKASSLHKSTRQNYFSFLSFPFTRSLSLSVSLRFFLPLSDSIQLRR